MWVVEDDRAQLLHEQIIVCLSNLFTGTSNEKPIGELVDKSDLDVGKVVCKTRKDQNGYAEFKNTCVMSLMEGILRV